MAGQVRPTAPSTAARASSNAPPAWYISMAAAGVATVICVVNWAGLPSLLAGA